MVTAVACKSGAAAPNTAPALARTPPKPNPNRSTPPATTLAIAETANEDDANAAYKARQWTACAAQWQAIAKRGGKTKPHRALYSAARCYSLDGQSDFAFAALDAAIAAGLRNVGFVERDADLAGLHTDPRWASTIRVLRERFAGWESSLKAPQLRRELLAMVDEDEAARNAWLAKKREEPEWKELGAKVAAVDKEHTKALRAAITKYGWPGKTVVGEDGAHAAWLLAQHADLDLPLQKDVLARMKLLVESGQVAGADYAYLYDRVAIAEHRDQLYGTQFQGTEPFPIEDLAHVDERRHAVGLSSLVEYRKLILEMSGSAK
jgi:hypothetical protein